MAFSSANIDSITFGLEGVAVGAADRCVPFLNKEMSSMSIADSQDAFDELREERFACLSQSDEMDWEETTEVTIPFIPAKVNPFLGAEAASKPVNPFVTAKVNPFLDAKAVSKPANPVNPFLPQPAATSLPVEMEIDEWSINDPDNTNANAQPARQRNTRNKQRNNQRQSKGSGNTTKSNNGGSNSTSHKPKGNNNSSRRRSNNGNKNRSQRE
ncbi:hypothetical protein PG996_015198 [Apiospora saccharicola]|uniref:Uncharacterized protein n=1 Tax=Apiospora saccharicola TaxID=335842 RepID=A0ABR1TN56_9PEZI